MLDKPRAGNAFSGKVVGSAADLAIYGAPARYVEARHVDVCRAIISLIQMEHGFANAARFSAAAVAERYAALYREIAGWRPPEKETGGRPRAAVPEPRNRPRSLP